jgi:hypothetical protein
LKRADGHKGKKRLFDQIDHLKCGFRPSGNPTPFSKLRGVKFKMYITAEKLAQLQNISIVFWMGEDWGF